MRLHCKYSVDGEYYLAEILHISNQKRRQNRPVKVNFVGYYEEAWLSYEDIKSKKLRLPKAAQPSANAKAQEPQEAKARGPEHLAVGPGGLCIAGESLIDMIPRETAGGEACFLPKPGGAPFNALLAACRLSIPVTYLATLSTDMFGEELYQVLMKEGVRLDLVSRIDRPTTLAFVSRKPGQGEKYAFFKENAADRALSRGRVRDVLQNHRFEAVHMSLGAVTLEDGEMAAAFHELYKGAGKQGALRTFDPNLRSNMIKGGAREYRRKVERLLRLVDVVKSSDDDIAFLYGAEAKHSEVAAGWLKLGCSLVVVTCGAEGAVAYRKGSGELRVTPPGQRPNTIDAEGRSAPVMDTVGAGDTFMGALIQGFNGNRRYEFQSGGALLLEQLLHGKAWDEASTAHLRDVLERAAVAAAINVSRPGCSPPTSEEVLRAGRALQLKFTEAVSA